MLRDMVRRSPAALLTFGAFGVLWGLILALWPGISALTFAVMWGVYALIDGISALVLAVREKEGRGWYVTSGILGVLAGIIVVVRPGMGVATVAWILGIWLVVRGIAELLAAWAPERILDRILVGAGGALWILAGFFVMANPAEAALTLTWLFGVLAITWGVMLIVAGFRLRSLIKRTLGAS